MLAKEGGAADNVAIKRAGEGLPKLERELNGYVAKGKIRKSKDGGYIS